jgi:hypothetical protein
MKFQKPLPIEATETPIEKPRKEYKLPQAMLDQLKRCEELYPEHTHIRTVGENNNG